MMKFRPLQLVRQASKTAAPKVDQKQLAQQREREQKKQQTKRENARFVAKLKDEAREFGQLPHHLSFSEALRYIRASEVGRSAHATTVYLEMRIVAERGVQKLLGTCRLPKPLDDEVLCVLTNSAEQQEAARAAGAAVVGGDALISEMRDSGETPYDRIYASPEIMPRLLQIAKMLGPRGLMPSPKRGTVVADLAAAVQASRGEMSFKQHDTFLRVAVGRAAFSDAEIVRNALTVTNKVRELLGAVPSAKKGHIGRTLISSTSSPSIVVSV